MVTGIIAGRPLVSPLVKNTSNPECWPPPVAFTSAAECQGSIEELVYPGCPSAAVNLPPASTVPALNSWMPYPTQLRMSSDPCSSQVFEDSVIHTRRNRVETESGATFSVTAPPFPSLTARTGTAFHGLSGARPIGVRPIQ